MSWITNIQCNSYTGDSLIFLCSAHIEAPKKAFFFFALLEDFHIKENENETLIIRKSRTGDILDDLKSTKYDPAEHRSLLKLQL